MKHPFINKFAGKKGNKFGNPRSLGTGSAKQNNQSKIAAAVKPGNCRA